MHSLFLVRLMMGYTTNTTNAVLYDLIRYQRYVGYKAFVHYWAGGGPVGAAIGRDQRDQAPIHSVSSWLRRSPGA